MNKHKAIFALSIGLLAVLAGLYFSGYLTLMGLQLDSGLKWNTYVRYFQALDQPQVAPYAGKIKWAGRIGFGVPLLLYAGLLALMFKPRPKSLHGEARFASASDLARQGMFKRTGTDIIVGRFKGKLVRFPGQQFAILAAPTRSGKGVGVVIPNLLDYQDSIVVLDIKQENFNLTSGWRQSQGQDIYLFNPFDLCTHRWNPLSYVSPDPAFRISDLQSMAAMLYPDGSSDQKFWISQARNAFTAFALYLFENFDDQCALKFSPENLAFPTLGRIYRLSSGDGAELKQYLQTLSRKPFLSEHARSAFANLLSQAEETFSSIMGSFKEPLNAFISPILDAATSHNDFLLTDLRRKKMTIYIGIQPNKLAECRTIINLFFSQAINVNTKTLPQDDPQLKYQCLLLMDEFTAIGRIDILATAVAYMAGYNLRLLPIIQSMAQLDAVYGKEVSRTILTNHALQIIYAPREQQDANDYSEMLGYTTVRKQNTTRGRDFSRSESEERRALMLPQELKAMGNDKEVFLYEGIPHPVMCQKIKYYQEKYFTRRLLPKVGIPQLTIGEAPMSSKTMQAVSAVASMALAACASQPTPAAETAQENSALATSAIGATNRPAEVFHPRLSAEQALLRVLELIRSSKTIADFTPEYLSKMMGVEMSSYGPGHYGFGEHLTPEWWHGLEMEQTTRRGPRFEFSFIAPPGHSPDATDICQVDYDRFAEELKKMGFTHERRYGSHGSLGYDLFSRPRQRVEVYSQGEANEPTDLINHLCIQSVVIR